MYKLLANQYSQLFPPDKNRCAYVLDEVSIKDKPQILDAGCATGDLAFELSDAGAKVTGIDLDADMIRIAQERAYKYKAGRSKKTPVFHCRSMIDIANLGSFDAVVCFGNTLPHLTNAKMVQDFFNQSASVLPQDGKLIFQIINFDKIGNRDNFDFPEINTGETIFKRSYRLRKDGRLDFQISLSTRAGGEEQSDSTPLLPLRRKDLLKYLKRAGFTDIEIYTDYELTPADGSEFASIYSAVKSAD